MSKYIESTNEDDCIADIPKRLAEEARARFIDESFARLTSDLIDEWHARLPGFTPSPFPPHVEAAHCALPDLRYIVYAGAVAAGALLGLILLLLELRHDRFLP